LFSFQIPKFWLDDIYVTGYLRELLGLRPFYLNLRYAYDEKSYLKWLHSKQPLPLPYLFASIEMTNPEWQIVLKQLWLKTLTIHLGKTSTPATSTTPSAPTSEISQTQTSITEEPQSSLLNKTQIHNLEEENNQESTLKNGDEPLIKLSR